MGDWMLTGRPAPTAGDRPASSAAPTINLTVNVAGAAPSAAPPAAAPAAPRDVLDDDDALYALIFGQEPTHG